ncbi:MAG TPA: response regulator [Acidobacteriota bacterium]
MHKILVVDDDTMVIQFLKNFLEKKNYQVVTASNGVEALEKVQQESPHIILMDVYMPQMGGLEALKKIKQINKEIGVIMVTAMEDEKLGSTALNLGAFDYIVKPLDLNRLQNLVWTKLQMLEKAS